MSTTITIPVRAHLITLEVTSQEVETYEIMVGRERQSRRRMVNRARPVPPRQTEESLRAGIESANRILASTDIRFSLVGATPETIQAPGNAETVTESGFHYLARQYPARRCVSFLAVSRFQRTDLGGQSIEEQSVCIVPHLDSVLWAKVTAHEFGHLLEMDHTDDDRYNLMYPGLSAAQNITASQVATARASRLATMFATSAAATP